MFWIQQHAERRSDLGFKAAMKFLHNGGLREVYLAKGFCYNWQDPSVPIQMDIARQDLGITLPTEVDSIGGHFMFQDDQKTPNTQTAVYEFPNSEVKGNEKKIMQFEERHWIPNHEGDFGSCDSNNIGNIFYGSEVYMTVSLGDEWKTFMGPKWEPGPSGGGRGNMWQNFVDSIRTNDLSKLEGDIVEGHHCCALIHLANISYRLG